MSEWLRLVRTVEPSAPVVTTAEAKTHCRIFHSDDDAYVDTLVAAATAAIEGPSGIGVALSPQTWRMSLDGFPCGPIEVPLGPVTEITGITYTGADGDVTVSGWRTDYDAQPCRIYPAADNTWPLVTPAPGVVKVTFTCGYAALPADLKAAILLLTAHFYEHREAVTTDIQSIELPLGVDAILNRYRVGRFA